MYIEEIRTLTNLPTETLVEIVELGIVEPDGQNLDSWTFSDIMLLRIIRAARISRDLEINYAGVALALSLIDELELLKMENKSLRRLIDRHMCSGSN